MPNISTLPSSQLGGYTAFIWSIIIINLIFWGFVLLVVFMHMSSCFCSFHQAHFRCCGSWLRRRGSRSCTLLSFRASSTAASGWWRELWPKTATSSLTTAAGTWRTKRGEQGGGERGWEERGRKASVFGCESTCKCLLACLKLRNVLRLTHAHCVTLGAPLFFKIHVFLLMSYSQGVKNPCQQPPCLKEQCLAIWRGASKRTLSKCWLKL